MIGLVGYATVGDRRSRDADRATGPAPGWHPPAGGREVESEVSGDMTAAVEAEPSAGKAPARPRPSSISWPSSTPSAGGSRAPARRDHRLGGRRASATTCCSPRPSRTAVLFDLAVEGGAGDRGRLPRHRVPLPRDPRLPATRSGALRPEPDRARAGGCRSTSWPCGTRTCCELRKVAPAQRAAGGQGGLDHRPEARRHRPSAPTPRSSATTPAAGLVKINPIATWTDDDVDDYVGRNTSCRDPSRSTTSGYLSIGCAPTTRPGRATASNPRDGRWAGTDKTECGLHLRPA